MQDDTTTEEQADQADVPLKQTPESAIQSQIFFLCRRRYELEQEDAPERANVLEYTRDMIAALTLAQQQLAELREIKRALAVLRGVGQ